MPLVRIDLIVGRTDEELRELADTVHECVVDVFGTHGRDRYQIITEHQSGRMFLEDTGLGITRSDGQMVIQITQVARAAAQKEKLYAALADRLGTRTGMRPEDLVVSVVDVHAEDWSFGYGRAQFLTGELVVNEP